MGRLEGKVAVVVGAGSIGPGWGNGKATAVTFARQGAEVFCVDRNQAAAEETAGIIVSEGGKATAFTADVSQAVEVEAMVAACLKTFGRIDVLDNNVGIAEMGSVVEVAEADWDRVFAVNLKSAYLAMKHVVPIMVRQGGGSVINISSIASIRHMGLSYVTYGASKAAMNQMTRT
ncbi:MAG: SDR family NAD(P)-dependent oxidoreductase, partial [Bradyrhizobium sp.]|nr:SDR family NAD(P)-dependent oxidoreductase [Bradyrhizobium sp.]